MGAQKYFSPIIMHQIIVLNMVVLVQEIIGGIFSDVQHLLKKGQKSDSFVSHL